MDINSAPPSGNSRVFLDAELRRKSAPFKRKLLQSDPEMREFTVVLRRFTVVLRG
jgi:hypothetical protein